MRSEVKMHEHAVAVADEKAVGKARKRLGPSISLDTGRGTLFELITKLTDGAGAGFRAQFYLFNRQSQFTDRVTRLFSSLAVPQD